MIRLFRRWDEDERRTSKQTEQPVAEGTPVVNSRGKAGALGSGRAGGIGARGLRQQVRMIRMTGAGSGGGGTGAGSAVADGRC
jgi:hypothetical protein